MKQDLEFHHFAECSSTMDKARALLGEDDSKSHLVIADYQTSGRGRHERKWIASEGNLYMTLTVNGFSSPRKMIGYSLVVGLAVADYLSKCDVEVDLKWPNDIYLQDKKVGGLLIEVSEGVALVGIGLNLGSAPRDLPDSAQIPNREKFPSALREIATEISQKIFEYSAIFQERGFRPFQQRYLERDCFYRKRVEVSLPDEKLIGDYLGVGEDGGLVINDNGAERVYYSVDSLRLVSG